MSASLQLNIDRGNGMDRSYWARVLLCCLALLAAQRSSMSAEAHEFTVGGTKGWSVPSGTDRTETYSQWAARNRFQVGDTLLFKYNRSVDSVVQVGTEEDYSSCNTSKAIKTFDDGNTVFQLNRSGPFYFITGNSGNCKKGQKLLLVVISPRHGAVGGAGPPPAPAPRAPGPRVASPAPNGSNSPAPAPAPRAPGPRVASPAPNGSNSPAPAPSIASSPSPSIAGIPATSPAPSAVSPASGTPSGSPTPSNGRGSPANAPRAGAPFAAPPAPPVSSPAPSGPTSPPPPQSAVRSPAPSPAETAGSPSPASASTPSVLLTLLCLAIGALSYYPAFG